MPAPAFVACPEGQWTQVATGTTSGQLKKGISTPTYLEFWVLTGNPGPAPTPSYGVLAFNESLSMPISAVEPIDVFIWCEGGPGSVRVDLGDGTVGGGS